MNSPKSPKKPASNDPLDAVDEPEAADDDLAGPACVMVFNASDPSGAAGLAADTTAIASVGAHALPVVTGAYARDTGEIFEHFCFDEEAVTEQARAVLEDVEVQVFKVGFVGSPENISAIAEITSDYAEVPVVAYMPNLSWWDEDKIDEYLDAFRELLLPQTTVLVGNHSTLRRWLLPDWDGERNPTPRDIAKAAATMGVPYTLVTGIPLPEQHVENVLTSPQAVLVSEKFELFEAVFTGAGETLSAALAALLASGSDLAEATNEAMSYLDRCLDGGFRPGMGHILPDRMFWAQPEDDVADDGSDPDQTLDEETLRAIAALEAPPHDHRH
ncbi:hydroxymethylpyrimidine/phosphomethylpyrimidine kinase [Rhodoferax ferrireducens]|uniref:Hydroxymethylpyrimidine/phosphomethylpyrimidine kinase n=1 Tax=Rhodoferax ferrireducens TaxID=192843 RepID=A0ABU2CCW8_9BURK|nr:bifunctional hydroxymethylpyrimidine kinase/phosphomethylpyrimidine kinase [Rhodoferax ferrireducens]MDR7379170.1 hydroxymethylpyrimidine/phosphomethylpyrimidine kinase [Rhodoferax ferrireducens]